MARRDRCCTYHVDAPPALATGTVLPPKLCPSGIASGIAEKPWTEKEEGVERRGGRSEAACV